MKPIQVSEQTLNI